MTTETPPRRRRPADHPAPRGNPKAAKGPTKLPRLRKMPAPPTESKAPVKTRAERRLESRFGMVVIPPPAEEPRRFERGELPVFLLQVLAEYGAQKRPVLTQAAFGASPTILQKKRINGAIEQLLTKGHVSRKGEMRSYLYLATARGRALVRQDEKGKKAT